MKGCLIGVAVLIVLVMAGALLVWNQRDTIITGLENVFDMPEYGKEEYILPLYGEQLQSILAAANNADSLFQFGAAIETMGLPEEVIYVGIEQGEETTDIIKKFDWSGHSLLSSGVYGAGSLSQGNTNKEIMTYTQEGDWRYMDKFTVYIEHKGDTKQLIHDDQK